MSETEHFVRDRFGWVCRRCHVEAAQALAEADERVGENQRASQQEGRARFFHEGESGERSLRLSTRGLARRRDTEGGPVLFCPGCGAEETPR